jgi:hypothetical protein
MRLIGRVDMPRKATSREGSTTKKKDAPGVSLEKLVVRVQQMMDPNSTVSHNERLEDRIGNTRQYDVVIRGRFGGRPVLGVIECKDHNRKKGPTAVEAFAKKTENLGANLRLMVSKKGFTKQALDLAKHEHIGCLSLLPADPKQAGFSIGDMWYGVIRLWTNPRLVIHFAVPPAPIATFRNETVKWGGKRVINWFARGEYCLSNYILICFPIVLIGNQSDRGEAWRHVRNARIRTWSRPARSGADNAGYVGDAGINLRGRRLVANRCGKNRWRSFSTATVSP